MANTEPLKREVEDFIRTKLARRFGVNFEKRKVPLAHVLPPRGVHEFDAVAADGSVIAGIISSAPRTSGGKRNVGAVHHATGELYYLSLAHAGRKLLICTDPEFHELMRSVMKGRLAKGLELVPIRLSPRIERLVRGVRRKASKEIVSRRTPRQ